MSLYFKKETAGWQKPEREAALVSLVKGSSQAQRGELGRQPWRGEEKETHDHKALIMKNESENRPRTTSNK